MNAWTGCMLHGLRYGLWLIKRLFHDGIVVVSLLTPPPSKEIEEDFDAVCAK